MIASQIRMDGPVAARLRRFASPQRVLLVGGAVAVAGAALIAAYAMVLSRAGIPASGAALLVVLLAATLSSIAGFAFSAICGVMLLQMVDDPVRAVEIMMVCSIAIQSLSVTMLWRDIDWRGLAVFVAGGAIGLPVGVGLLLHLGHGGFRQVIGGLLTCYAAWMLFQRPLVVRSPAVGTIAGRMADLGVGFLGGITGGLAGFPGAAVTVWCGMRGWDKRRQRGTYQPFILIMQVLALLLIHCLRGAAPHGADFGMLQFVPAALLGTWFGLAIFGRMSDRVFAVTVNLLLLASGVGLLV